MMSPSLPPPGGGAIGVLATSGLMSSMYLTTVNCVLSSFGLIPSRMSVLHGTPRSARLIAAHSGEFTHQSINATTASGFLVLAEADQSMDALYHVLRSVALPVKLGKRNIAKSVPAAVVTADSWLE